MLTSKPPRRQLSRRRFMRLGAATGAAGLAAAVGYGVESTDLPAPYANPATGDDALGAGLPRPDVPLLLVINPRSANTFGRYLGEILRAEGLNAFRVARLDQLDRDYLANYALVLLGEGALDANEVALLTDYVASGGALIAMRPDPQLAGLLGVAFTGGQTADGYLRIVDEHSVCQGIAATMLQFHGPADHMRLDGAGALAWLYSDATTATSFPLITLHNAGKGKAALWAFDLARSVALTRQGNPEWANQERDDLEGIRACDMFMGWIDLERIAIPQADEQQRLLANLIHELCAGAGPMPRLWYFPSGASAVLVTTGDSHINPVSVIEDVLARVERYGGRMSVYYTPPFTDAARRIVRKARWWMSDWPLVGGLLDPGPAVPKPAHVAAWRARGHEFGMHPFVEMGVAEGYHALWNHFLKLGYGPVSPTVRTHRILWKGWVETARVQARYGIRMNLDYYHVGPALRNAHGEWVYGHMTGSGLPLRFIDETGTILNVYQQHTHLVDEHLLDIFAASASLSAEEAIAVSQRLIRDSLRRFPAALGMQCHIDPFQMSGQKAANVARWLEGSLAYAAEHNVPILSAEQWLAFIEARSSAEIGEYVWEGGAGRLSFRIALQGAPEIMLPLYHAGRRMGQVQVNGSAVAYRERVLGGQRYAAIVVPAGRHTIQISYAGR